MREHLSVERVLLVLLIAITLYLGGVVTAELVATVEHAARTEPITHVAG